MDRNALSRATEASESPTPGYLFVDIAKSAAASPAASLETVQYLIRRLQSKNNPNVKYKCLKVIAKTSESAVTRGQFKRAVAQDARAVGAIKECLQFRGPPDPVRGEEPHQRVRDAAKEALEAVYSDTPSSSDAGAGPGPGTYAGIGGGGISGSYGISPHSAGGSIGGYGAPAGGGPAPGGGGGGARKMEGIGNPMYKDPRLQQSQGGMTIGEMAKVAGETVVAMAKDPLAKNVPMGPPPGSSQYSGPPPGRNELARATGGEWTMASNRGPNAINPSQSNYSERDQTYYNARNSGSQAFQWAQQQGGAVGGASGVATSGGVGGSWGVPSAGAPPSMSVAGQSRAAAHGTLPSRTAPSIVPSGSGGTAASDGTYEKNLVMELCPPGGMKAEPPPEKLAAFLRSFPSLNPDLVCPALLDALEDGQPWIIKAKALCVIERVIQSAVETIGDSNPYSDFFHACSEEIEPLASHNRSAIRDPAKRALRALDIDGGAVTAAARKSPAAAPAPPVEPPNLLDFNDDPVPASTGGPTAPPPAAAPPPPAEEAAPTGNMFGGLKVQEAKAAPVLLPAASVTAPAQATGGLFGDMTVKTPGLTTGQPAASEPESNKQENVTSPTTAGLFGSVDIKESSNKADTALSVGQAAAGTGSAFGFISGSAPSSSPLASPSAKVKTAAVPPPASPTKEAFDPLLSLGTEPTNEQKVQNTQAQIAQMQAMAMQQNMMMMQQQMQQMQLAMAMQQQKGGRAGVGTRSMVQVGGPINPNVMRASSIVEKQPSATGDATKSFSFLDNPNQGKKEETHAFDFVMDSMKTEKK